MPSRGFYRCHRVSRMSWHLRDEQHQGPANSLNSLGPLHYYEDAQRGHNDVPLTSVVGWAKVFC